MSTVENPISARSAEEVASVSTGGSGVNARSVEEQAYVRTGGSRINARSVEGVLSVSTGGSAIRARSASRKSMLDVLCLTMRILVCKAEWLSSVRKNIRSNTQMVRSSQ